MSIAFVADLHLKPLTWQDQPDMRGDAYMAWLQVVNKCIDQGVEALLIGGDIFDKSRPDSESVDAFVVGIDMLTKHGILVYFTQGQHDRADPPWASALSPQIKYIGDGQPALIKFDDTSDVAVVRGYDNMPAAQLKAELEGLKEVDTCPDIVLVHQLEKTLMHFEGAWDFDMSWVPEDVKLILGGDYHAPVEAGRLWYSGSTYSTNITEFSQRSFLKISVLDDGTYDVERIPLELRDVLDCAVVTDAHLADVVKVIDAMTPSEDKPETLRRPLVFVKYSANVTDALPALQEACQRGGQILRTKVLAGGVEVVGDIEKPSGDVSLAGCMAQVVNREEDEEFYSFALALLTSPRPADVLTEAKARLGVA